MTLEFLRISANLYNHLSEPLPEGEDRTTYIDQINVLLEERETSIQSLKQQGFQFDSTDKLHSMLLELDKGINEKLQLVMHAVKEDMKELQTTKKVEHSYINPYDGIVRNNAKYFDSKK